MVSTSIVRRLSQPVGILPLVVLRIAFGAVMFVSTLRFFAKGWVSELYIEPQFHFTYLGFGWIKPLPGNGMIWIFAAIAVVSLCIALGFHYRLSMALFFLLFTYVELIDVAYYLNHYYFVSVLSLLLIFLPLERSFSLDVRRRPELWRARVPAWTIDVIRLQIALVYFFAGIAKLNPDWLLEAMPLHLWLATSTDTPLLGSWLDQIWVAYLFSWSGLIFDLSIPFLLMWRRTRFFAYGAVILFHSMTAVLFNIGMFPWLMIACTLVFFTQEDFQSMQEWVQSVTQGRFDGGASDRQTRFQIRRNSLSPCVWLLG